MKSSKGQTGSITQPLLQELLDRQKTDFKTLLSKQVPTLDSKAVSQPALYEQDCGSGYNADFVFPQE